MGKDSGAAGLPVRNRCRAAPRGAVPTFALHSLLGGALLASVTTCGVGNAQVVQAPPDAGRALRDTAPAPIQPLLPPAPGTLPAPSAAPVIPAAAPAGPAFLLQGVAFTGNTVFDSATLASVVADQIGSSVTFAQLEAVAARLTARYRGAGYVLAQVIVPQQEIVDGKVTLSVVEGRLGKVKVDYLSAVPLPPATVTSATSRLTPGLPLNQRQLERVMLLLSDLPGVAPQSSIESGEEPGTFDLIIELNAAPKLNFSADIDTYGSRSTGIFRAGGFMRVNSPLGLGDNLDARVLHSLGTGLTFGRIGYEVPLGYESLRAGVAFSRVSYELGHNLAALGASGSANVREASLSYALIRSRNRNLFAKLTYEHKSLDDDITTVQQASRKTLQNLGAGFVFEGRDNLGAGGYTNLGVTAYFGKLDIGSAHERALDQSAAGLQTNGRFVRVSYLATRLQSLTDTTSAFAGLSGQWANHNLDSAEKVAIGGASAVRAYSSSAGIGDAGQIFNVEYRWTFVPAATASLFYDIGHVRGSHDPLPATPNSQTLHGAGVGLFWNAGRNLTARGSIAWRGSGPDQAGETRTPRLYAQLSKTF